MLAAAHYSPFNMSWTAMHMGFSATPRLACIFCLFTFSIHYIYTIPGKKLNNAYYQKIILAVCEAECTGLIVMHYALHLEKTTQLFQITTFNVFM